MPVYRLALEIEVLGDDVDAMHEVIDELSSMDGITITSASPFSDNPPDYPDDDEE